MLNFVAWKKGYDLYASIAYSEQVGVKRQEAGNRGDNNFLYVQSTKIANLFISGIGTSFEIGHIVCQVSIWKTQIEQSVRCHILLVCYGYDDEPNPLGSVLSYFYQQLSYVIYQGKKERRNLPSGSF